MQSLAQEIQSFSRARLKRQCTRVTCLSGRRVIETWKGSSITVEEEPTVAGPALGYVPDTSWDLQVGAVTSYLLLGSQDAAHDFSTLQKHKVSHILNVAFGVDNVFPELFIYKTVSILDQPDTPLIGHIQECCDFITQARTEKGVVLVHCNTGVSRAPAVVIGYLMSCDGMSFEDALSLVRTARPNSAPNPGFMEQLQKYQSPAVNGGLH
ncbi:dual specificity protein phosphatase 19 isoform X1 [Boleophthalmus pectinirostris]|uniref:dual specificity protein phosphatase 19 isoform X1 n=1 Tax=Boleophthalmus pectinirostris TaxID=150288 RepID=UPI000A1C1D3E|nr:dual specificity protein phosphatase 19 isoform X1 [Boleophthalmus pectinirostris]